MFLTAGVALTSPLQVGLKPVSLSDWIETHSISLTQTASIQCVTTQIPIESLFYLAPDVWFMSVKPDLTQKLDSVLNLGPDQGGSAVAAPYPTLLEQGRDAHSAAQQALRLAVALMPLAMHSADSTKYLYGLALWWFFCGLEDNQEPVVEATPPVRVGCAPEPFDTPLIPELASLVLVTGTVWVRALIDETGTVIDARILKRSDSHVGFEEAAIEWAYRQRYQARIRNGGSAAAWITYKITWSLKR